MAEDPYIKRMQAAVRNQLRHFAILRSRHFKRVFRPDGKLSADAEIVLADLRDFCRANQSTFAADPYIAARWQGRREVWLRISQHLNLDEEQVQKLVELDDGQ